MSNERVISSNGIVVQVGFFINADYVSGIRSNKFKFIIDGCDIDVITLNLDALNTSNYRGPTDYEYAIRIITDKLVNPCFFDITREHVFTGKDYINLKYQVELRSFIESSIDITHIYKDVELVDWEYTFSHR